MNKISAPYYCCQCKKVSEKVDQLLFVEDTSSRGFCSEGCIEEFYAPIIAHFNNVEKELRNILDCRNESPLDDPQKVERVLSDPDEIWKIENALGDELYTFIKLIDGSSVIIACLLFNQRPSFILMATMTQNEQLLKNFQTGTAIDDIDAFLVKDDPEPEMDMEMVSGLEQQKSALLATLLEQRKDSDIEYEKFYLYEEYLETTLHSPDEIYSYQNEIEEDLYTYIKAHYSDGVSFYYIVICLRSGEMMVPILSFPTLDPKLCDLYKEGEKVSGTLVN